MASAPLVASAGRRSWPSGPHSTVLPIMWGGHQCKNCREWVHRTLSSVRRRSPQQWRRGTLPPPKPAPACPLPHLPKVRRQASRPETGGKERGKAVQHTPDVSAALCKPVHVDSPPPAVVAGGATTPSRPPPPPRGARCVGRVRTPPGRRSRRALPPTPRPPIGPGACGAPRLPLLCQSPRPPPLPPTPSSDHVLRTRHAPV